MVNLVRAEIIKQSRLGLVRVVILGPLLFAGVIGVILVILKLSGNDFGPLPSGSSNGLEIDFGDGALAVSSQIFLGSLSGLFALGLVLVGAQTMNHEFTWNTIKMLATREPSRTRLLLGKMLFLLIFALLVMLIVIFCWLFMGFVFKIVYNDTLGFTSADADAFGKGLAYICPNFLTYAVYSMLGMAVATRFKSTVGAVIAYFIWVAADGLSAGLGAAALKGQIGGLPQWAEPFINILKITSPFQITTNQGRLTQPSSSVFNLPTISPVQAVLVLVAWGAIFVGLGILVLNRRDIND